MGAHQVAMVRQSVMPVVEALTARVESLTPTVYSDVTFSCPRYCLGASDAEGWIQDFGRSTRDFVVYVSSLPTLTDANAPCHISTVVTVAVAYRADLADDVRDGMMVDDCTAVMSAVIARPDLWGGADSVWPRDGGANVIEISDEQGAVQCYVVQIPFLVVLH